MIASTRIRKDLCRLGLLGRRGQGYAIDPLVERLAWVLGLEHDVAALGTRAVLNFAPTPLLLHGPVFVRNIDLAGEMAIATPRLNLE
ncbi:MAG: hypothetical protein WBE79_02805 [Candidatus Cybelea sp.]|jgi:NADH/NAD ratio-sensing transcriptional regulator Rex